MANKYQVEQQHLTQSFDIYHLELALSQRLILELEAQAEWFIKQKSSQQDIPNFLNFISSKALASVKPNAVSYIH